VILQNVGNSPRRGRRDQVGQHKNVFLREPSGFSHIDRGEFHMGLATV